jgi:hypothetical protein
MDDLTPRRQAAAEMEAAWFKQEWARLNTVEREAISAFLIELHDDGLRSRPAAVAWLDRHRS